MDGQLAKQLFFVNLLPVLAVYVGVGCAWDRSQRRTNSYRVAARKLTAWWPVPLGIFLVYSAISSLNVVGALSFALFFLPLAYLAAVIIIIVYNLLARFLRG